MKNTLLFICAIIAICISCNNSAKEITESNPAAPGFNSVESDIRAIEIADEVMEAMGGRQAWDTSQYISWTFFGRRNHIWDKINGYSRIEIPSDSLEILIDLNDKTGSVLIKDVAVVDQDTVGKYVDAGYKMWINDSYWLVMPFKLKDSGVTLKYIGKDTTTTGMQSDVLQLTFEEVGVTPDNKYLVYVDEASKLVAQWDYYANFEDSLPRFQSLWPSYEQYGPLRLSGGTIRNLGMTNIGVSQKLDEDIFEKLLQK